MDDEKQSLVAAKNTVTFTFQEPGAPCVQFSIELKAQTEITCGHRAPAEPQEV